MLCCPWLFCATVWVTCDLEISHLTTPEKDSIERDTIDFIDHILDFGDAGHTLWLVEMLPRGAFSGQILHVTIPRSALSDSRLGRNQQHIRGIEIQRFQAFSDDQFGPPNCPIFYEQIKCCIKELISSIRSPSYRSISSTGAVRAIRRPLGQEL
jgi:hypothetical protein